MKSKLENHFLVLVSNTQVVKFHQYAPLQNILESPLIATPQLITCL